MTKEQRTAMARIISDMIKADNIIEESEIKDMKQLMSKYSISRQNMNEARKIRFSDAVTILQALSITEREKFFESIYKLSLSDNLCVPREVLYLIALKYCLVKYDDIDTHGDRIPKPYLISCPTGESTISDQYMVYLEGKYSEQHNTEIVRDFKLLVTQCRLNGFNFVYIPKLVEEFKGMDSRYVKDVISYMAPHLDDNVVSDVYNRLCDMTTTEFFHNVLYENLQVKAIYDAKPSILINIGNSVVPYCSSEGPVQYYTEFLCIPIPTTTLSIIEEVLTFYQNKVSIKTVTINDNKGQFKYFGFYKALFDFLIAPPPVAPDLIFLGQNITDGKYYVSYKFYDGRERKMQLMPKRYELYFQIATRTHNSRTKGLPAAKIDKTAVSHLRSQISEFLREVSFADQYKPEKVGNLFVLRLDKDKIFKRTYTTYSKEEYTDIPITKYKQ